MNVSEQIIDYIQRNRVSTTEILDIFNKDWKHFIPQTPLNKGNFRVGKVYPVGIFDESNYWCHKDLVNVPENSIVLVLDYGSNNRAAFGSLVCKYLFLYRKVSALVSQCNLRDGAELVKENYPIWCKGLVPVGCYNKYSVVGEERYAMFGDIDCKGSIAVCDDSGIALIPEDRQNMEFLRDLRRIEWQEDTWFSEVDSGKDTFDVVCLKTYLDRGVTFEKHLEKLEKEK